MDGLRERLIWRNFEEDRKESANLNAMAPVKIKEEVDTVTPTPPTSRGRWSTWTPASSTKRKRKLTETQSVSLQEGVLLHVLMIKSHFQDADVYLTEYIKVEAHISPKLIQKFVIPVDIPYSEPKKQRVSRLPADDKQSVIGKIQMRKISDLQKPAPLRICPPVYHWDRRPRHGSYDIPPPVAPPCFCHQCVSWNTFYQRSLPCLPPRPLNPAVPVLPSALWRPFL